jgi:predicted unusual protein kinase regulating ubiquinone biosynthesis (AarF/ABC1/UbiB family)
MAVAAAALTVVLLASLGAIVLAPRPRAWVPTGRIRRAARVARLSSRSAARWVVRRARETGRSGAERARIADEFHLATAEDVAAAMGNLKGAFMKLGQMLSYLDVGLPAPYRAALASLREGAPPMSYALATKVVEEELGRPPEAAFAY